MDEYTRSQIKHYIKFAADELAKIQGQTRTEPIPKDILDSITKVEHYLDDMLCAIETEDRHKILNDIYNGLKHR